MKDFYDHRGYKEFIHGAHKLMMSSLSDFFSADVTLIYNPINELKHEYNIDITVNSKRNCYKIDDNTVVLISHLKDVDDYYLGTIISASHIGYLTKIFNVVSTAISSCLKQCAQDNFRNSIAYFGDRLIIDIISFHQKSNYSIAKIIHLIDKFVSLRSTTFEGKHFSTGLLLTPSIFDYKKQDETGRTGDLLALTKYTNFLDHIENRYWYIVDGVRTFYLTDLKKDIHYLFVYSDIEGNFYEKMMLSKALKGRDVLFRTFAGREVSIITSQGIEFINQENCWRYRDYNLLKKRILATINITDEVYNSLLYYVLFCSKNDISSLIWVPKDLNKYQDSLKKSTINKLTKKSFNITNQIYSSLIKRLLSSDGATVISTNGDIVAYGCMVDVSSARPSGVKGTGETAAGQLAKNGLAIKVSQDGTIKVFLNGRDKPIKF